MTARAGTTRKPHLRLVAKPVPEGLSVSCKFPVGKALEVERVLSAADDPAASSWREGYCEWISEVRDKNCRVGRDFFYYERLCPYQR